MQLLGQSKGLTAQWATWASHALVSQVPWGNMEWPRWMLYLQWGWSTGRSTEPGGWGVTFILEEDITHPPRLFFANRTLINGLGQEWPGTCVLCIPTKNMQVCSEPRAWVWQSFFIFTPLCTNSVFKKYTWPISFHCSHYSFWCSNCPFSGQWDLTPVIFWHDPSSLR